MKTIHDKIGEEHLEKGRLAEELADTKTLLDEQIEYATLLRE